MKNNKGFTIIELVFVLAIIALVLLGPVGWIKNLSKLANCDFEAPYKTEVIRAVGVPIVPVGVIAGYMDIGEENDK